MLIRSTSPLCTKGYIPQAEECPSIAGLRMPHDSRLFVNERFFAARSDCPGKILLVHVFGRFHRRLLVSPSPLSGGRKAPVGGSGRQLPALGALRVHSGARSNNNTPNACPLYRGKHKMDVGTRSDRRLAVFSSGPSKSLGGSVERAAKRGRAPVFPKRPP